MNLGEIRELFKEASGRYDLYDAGTNGDTVSDIFFISRGGKYLDLRYPQPENFRWHKIEISAGELSKAVAGLIIAKELWVMESGDKRSQVVWKPLGYLKSHYDEDSNDLDTGAPKYWSGDFKRLDASQRALGAGDFSYDVDEVLFDATLEKRGILWMPPADATYMLSIFGEFYSHDMSAGSDLNCWSANFPEALVHSAMLALERFYRNFEGVRDQAANILDIMLGPDYSNVDRETVGLVNSQMEG